MSTIRTVEQGTVSTATSGDSFLLANSFHVDKVEYFRNLFEHLYRQPAAVRPLPPGVQQLTRIGAALGGLLSSSGGEHMMLVLTGQIEPSVTARDMQFASAALERTGTGVSHLQDQWSKAQKSAFLRTAAVVGEDLTYGEIDEATAREAIQMLIQAVNGMGSSQPRSEGTQTPSFG